jgi:hypothetical protein
MPTGGAGGAVMTPMMPRAAAGAGGPAPAVVDADAAKKAKRSEAAKKAAATRAKNKAAKAEAAAPAPAPAPAKKLGTASIEGASVAPKGKEAPAPAPAKATEMPPKDLVKSAIEKSTIEMGTNNYKYLVYNDFTNELFYSSWNDKRFGGTISSIEKMFPLKEKMITVKGSSSYPLDSFLKEYPEYAPSPAPAPAPAPAQAPTTASKKVTALNSPWVFKGYSPTSWLLTSIHYINITIEYSQKEPPKPRTQKEMERTLGIVRIPLKKAFDKGILAEGVWDPEVSVDWDYEKRGDKYYPIKLLGARWGFQWIYKKDMGKPFEKDFSKAENICRVTLEIDEDTGKKKWISHARTNYEKFDDVKADDEVEKALNELPETEKK